jgi:hypothetical protein
MTVARALIVDDRGLVLGKVVFGPSDEVSAFDGELPLGGTPMGRGIGSIPASPRAAREFGAAPAAHQPQGPSRHGIGPGYRQREQERAQEKQPTFRPGVGPGSKSTSEDARPTHFTTSDVRSAVQGDRPTGGSAYLAHERAWIGNELKGDPSLKAYLRGVLAHEQSPGERSKVFESLSNRLNMLRAHGEPNLTLKDYLSRKGSNQFYGPIRRGLVHGIEDAGIDREIDKVLGGSNDIRGMTDQGSRGDPNFGRGETIMSHGEGYNDFSAPGARAWREQQQQRVAQGGGSAPVGVTRLGPGETPKVAPSADLSGLTPRGSANLFSSGRAAKMGIPGGIASNLTTITTPSGTKLQVNEGAAPHFKAFLDELASTGYKLNDVSSLNVRPKRGGGGWSEHAYGNAIDINPAKNPFHSSQTDLPANVSEMAARHGLTWGGDWKEGSKDPMHFEWTGASGESKSAKQSEGK